MTEKKDQSNTQEEVQETSLADKAVRFSDATKITKAGMFFIGTGY